MNPIILKKGRETSEKALAFIRSLPLDRGWQIEVKAWRPTRTEAQNRYLWGVCYPSILRDGGEALGGWEAKDLHEFFLGEHFGWETVRAFGKLRQRPLRRSARLNKQEFSDLIAFIQRKAAELGCYIPDADEFLAEAAKGEALKLQIVPCSISDASEFVAQYHRHHRPPLSGLFAVACAFGESIEGVAIVGRPVARGLDDGWTAEVTRVAVRGEHRNSCSILYSACWRAARAIGYRKLITYTLASEGGASLRGAGWKICGEVRGRSWHCDSRPRVDRHPLQDKFRWEIQ